MAPESPDTLEGLRAPTFLYGVFVQMSQRLFMVVVYGFYDVILPEQIESDDTNHTQTIFSLLL